MTRTTLVLLTGVVAATFLACGGTGQSGQVLAQASLEAPVAIQTFQFQPGDLTVRAGTRVTWTNQDQIAHTVTSGTPESRDGKFDSPLNGQGAKFSFTFSQAGTHPYFCNRHQSMRGQIRVN